MSLTRNIHNDRVRRALVFGIIAVCKELSIKIIAEGIECKEERDTLYTQGIHLFQGYYFARPGFESLPTVSAEAFS